MTHTPILAAPDKAVDPLPTVWDPSARVGEMLKGKRGLVIGVANADSIEYGCAVKLRAFGADIALAYPLT
jgi:enoyl-[acyl-carrier protein] reductase I